ncbi:DUF5565 family protein [uncultured Paraglaciecola sp.]|uniref:RNA ligase 1 family protein n=1 Tax=uncultured Paraglaciecola sp. TaxID=1765024 RepID=UPI002605F0E1|nr:DUF5565 family protein [uncultured Paraglaciecola sp.]
MKKIPTIFKRNPENMSSLIDECHPDCLWVFNGEGVATRKLDGTSCLVRNGKFYKRREVKKGKTPPQDFIQETFDEVTGKRTGWVPVIHEDKWHMEAWNHFEDGARADGTYELVGPKIQGNPEKSSTHELLRHDYAQVLDCPFIGLKEIGDWLEGEEIEGVVWHHPDGRMAKIKRRDFGFDWPVTKESK